MSSTSDLFTRADSAAQFLLSHTKLRPKIGLVLGSGLGAFADQMSDAARIPYSQIPGFPRSTAIGHAGQMVIGSAGGIPAAVMQGRVHLYEGYSAEEVAFPMRVFGRMGIRAAIITNAAGGINLKYQQGALVVISDHINLQGCSPLVGANDDRFGLRFPDMTRAYSREYAAIAREEAARLGIELEDGVYAALLGPSYETPAEIGAFRKLGADAVGMSTVPEAIVARQCGLRVAALSCITNRAAGLEQVPLSHEEVLANAARASNTAGKILTRFASLYSDVENSG